MEDLPLAGSPVTIMCIDSRCAIQSALEFSDSTVLNQKFRRSVSLVEGCVMERSHAVQILRVDIGAGLDQQLGDCRLVGVSGGVQWSRSPVLVLIVRVYVYSGSNQEGNDLAMPLPGCAVQCRRAVGILRREEVAVVFQQHLQRGEISRLGGL